MTMTDEEIIREYREAKTPLKQIRILADENQCSRKEIVAILAGAGLEIPAVYRRTEDVAPAATPLEESQGPAKGGTEHGQILPAPEPEGFMARVNDGAVEVIARLVAASDAEEDRVSASWECREQVRGVLALVYELRGGTDT